ncbi:MAG TPA: HAD-IA family hydrolase [Burkholderiales bacterium]|nr:HAD-IA family hydrolase [Burkholderiales bacterium]
MPTTTVLFDLFHTLTGLESQWCELPFTYAVLGVDRKAWDRLITTGSRWRLAGEERDPRCILARLAREIDPAISDAVIEEAAQIRSGRFRGAMQRIPPENVETLKRLRGAGYSLGLISNADCSEIAFWKESPLAGLFDAEVFSCEAGCVKPEPQIYHKCLEALGRRPEECIFIGDGGSNELAAARQIGMRTVFISGVLGELWPEKVAERMEVADHHITWIPELLPLLGVASQPA